MFGLGMSEIIVLGIMALIFIGPKELPEIARTLGRFLNELKRSSDVLTDELKQQVRMDLHNSNVQTPPPEDPSSIVESDHGTGPHREYFDEPEQQQLELVEQTTDVNKKEEKKS